MYNNTCIQSYTLEDTSARIFFILTSRLLQTSRTAILYYLHSQASLSSAHTRSRLRRSSCSKIERREHIAVQATSFPGVKSLKWMEKFIFIKFIMNLCSVPFHFFSKFCSNIDLKLLEIAFFRFMLKHEVTFKFRGFCQFTFVFERLACSWTFSVVFIYYIR